VDPGALDLEQTVSRIIASSKYRSISEETVRDVVWQEFSYHSSQRRLSQKQTYRRIRERLHRIWASYLGLPDFGYALTSLRQAFESGDGAQIERVCLEILCSHHSSRERLPVLSEMYGAIFSRTGIPGRVHDLACAVNPLAFRWMGLSHNVRYHAYDINRMIVELVNCYFLLEGLGPLAEHRDVLCRPPSEQGDVGLLLKMYHCLEQRRRGAGWQLIESVPDRWLAVSFPTRSLASRRVNIAESYEDGISARCHKRGWSCDRLDLREETVLLIEKSRNR
jgi:16S rRNA (guanine(1405)-N(7))-methyltransferase